VDWSPVTSILALPIFRHPIELHFTRRSTHPDFLDVVSSLEQNSDMKRLLEDGTLVTFMNENWSQHQSRIDEFEVIERLFFS
jgi:hypothetical protein